MSKTKLSLVLYGDSLLGRFGKALIDQLEECVPGLTVYNCATGGFNSDDSATRAAFIVRLRPTWVLCSVGANDVAPWKKQVTTARYRKNIRTIMNEFSGSKMMFLLCPLMHNLRFQKEMNVFNSRITVYNKITETMAQARGADIIDAPQAFSRMFKSGKDYHVGDGVHMNAKAYQVLIREIQAILQS